MADITLPYTPTTGVVSSASGFNSDVYHPTSPTPDSFDVINGFLDRANRESAWKVPWNKIRPKSCGEQASVGATANLDYFGVMFPQNVDAPGAFLPIPGAAKEVYVKRAGGNVLVHAQVVVDNSLLDNVSGAQIILFRRAPSDTSASQLAGSRQIIPAGVFTAPAPDAHRIYRQRQFAFHYLDIGVVRGNYEYYLGVWAGTAGATVTLAAGYPSAKAMTVRIRTRAMTAFWLG